MRSEMGNNNVVAGPKEEDKPRTEDQEKPQSEENNGINYQEENQVVSEEENKDLHEQTQGLSFNVPLAENQPLELTEEDKSKTEIELFNSGDVPDISDDDNDQENVNQEKEDKEFYIASPMSEEHENAISSVEILVENVESSYIRDEEKQELQEREQVTEVAQDVELFGDKIDENLKNEKLLVHDRGSEAVKILSQSKENKDTYLVDDKLNEKNESAIGMAHDNDSKVIETILENEASKDENIASQIKNTSGNGIENIEIKEKETHIVSNIEGKITDQSSDLEEETVKYMEIEKDIELSVIAEEKGKSEAEMPYSDSREADFRNSLNIQDEKQDLESEQISLKSPKLPYSDSNKADSVYSLKIQDEKQDLASDQISLKPPELPYSDSQKADSVYSLNIQDKKQDLGSEVTSLGLPKLPFSDFQEADSWKIQDEKQDVRSEVTSLELPELPYSDSQEADSWKTQDEKQDLKSEPISLKSAELPYSDSHEANSGNSLNIQDEKQDFESEQVSLKSPGSDFELGKLETLDPSCSLSLLETKTMTVLETEKNNGRLSTGSIQEKPNLAPELKKSTSFVFDLPLELKFIESDQTPLLFQNKTICRSMSSPSSPPVFSEEKTIQVQRNDSRKLSGPFPDLVKNEGNESFSKQDFKTGSKENLLTKGSGKRRPRSSIFTTCICCAAAIS